MNEEDVELKNLPCDIDGKHEWISLNSRIILDCSVNLYGDLEFNHIFSAKEILDFTFVLPINGFPN